MALPRFTTLACSAALMLCGVAAQAAGNSHSGNNQRSQYQQDRAACAHVPAASRSACIREAGAAAQAARNGQLTSPGDSSFERNATARCEVFKTQEDKRLCEERMRNKPVSGSVEEGGVLREATTTVTLPAQR
ncbi:hypothetical protein [Melaminivora sp.]|uniref:hypothetical protein n=1 Tax=Melaminivora sp. TaxID=1933032 RepID=UPI0028A958D9|nr:hypothetical protein [Melaminivora sp.]